MAGGWRNVADGLVGAVVHRPRTILTATLAVTAVLAWQATGVRIDSSVEALLPDGHPAVLQDREIKEDFDSREMILVGVMRPDGILNAETLGKIRDLSKEIQSLDLAEPADARHFTEAARRAGAPWDSVAAVIAEGGLTAQDRAAVSNLLVAIQTDRGVDPAFVHAVQTSQYILNPVSRVISLTEVDDLVSAGGELEIVPLVDDASSREPDRARLARRIYGNDMYVRGIVSPDTTGTAILVEMSFHYDRTIALAHRLFQRLDSLADRYRGPEDIRLAGVPMVNVYTSNYMRGDMTRLMPVVALVVFLVMLASFRSWRLALLPLGVVVTSLVWVLGIMGALGRPITLVVSAMPVILVAVGVADGIHMISEFRSQFTALGDRGGAVRATMHALAAPIVFTSLTDMAGFGSLGVSSLASIRDFGLFTSVGVLSALVLSLTALPAALVVLHSPSVLDSTSGRRVVDRLLEKTAGFAIRRRRWVSAGALGIVLLAALSLTHLRVGSTMVGYFHKDSEIYRASEMLNALFGGTEVLNVVVDTRRDDGLKDPEVLRKISELQGVLESDSLVGYTTSIADYVQRIHYVLHDERPDQNRLPQSVERVAGVVYDDATGIEQAQEDTVGVPGRDVVAQYLLLYQNAGGQDLEELADFDYRKANIVAQIRTDRTPDLRRIKDAAAAFAQAQFGPEAQVTFAGCSYLCIVADDLIIPGQVRSLVIAVVVVLVLLGLIFGSVRLGLLGIAPLAVTVLVVFGLMSLFGVYLDAVTALIASIVLGVGIDYSVHLLSRFQAHRAAGLETDEAIRGAIHASGRPILHNSLAVALGFAVLLLSNFWPVMHIGWLVSVTMILGAVFTLVLLPALLSGTSPVRQPAQNVGNSLS